MYKTHADFCEDFAAENCHRINCASCEEIFDFIKPEIDAKDARILELERQKEIYLNNLMVVSDQKGFTYVDSILRIEELKRQIAEYEKVLELIRQDSHQYQLAGDILDKFNKEK